MLDKLPAQVRHLVIAFASVFIGNILQNIVTASGVTGLNWVEVLVDSVNISAVATATVALVLYVTPLTNQYGKVSKK